ncbi:MAG: hypothetical protein WBV84_02880 [Nitrososphaeraceae archaeon]
MSSSLSPISRQKEMATLGKDISDGTAQFSIDGQRLYNIINSNKYGEHAMIIDIKGNGSNYIPSPLDKTKNYLNTKGNMTEFKNDIVPCCFFICSY